MNQEIYKALNELKLIEDAIEVERNVLQKTKDSLIPEEIKQRLEEVDAEFSDRIEGMQNRIGELTDLIKTATLQEGETCQGEWKEAVYCKGRTSWDTKGLDKAILLIPGLAEYRKQGEPYITIRNKTIPKVNNP